MKKTIIAIFVSFALFWYFHVLVSSILTIIHNRDEMSWQWFVMHPQPRNFLLNLLLGIVAFGVGIIINTFIVHIRKLEKKTILRILAILVAISVAVDQSLQLVIAQHHETIGVIPLVEGWLEINVQQFAGRTTVSERLIFLGIAVIIGFFIFRVALNFSPIKSYLYASSAFLIAGILCSALNAIFHNMGYIFINVYPLMMATIHNFYLFIGMALFFQDFIVNRESLKSIKSKDTLSCLRNELGLIKKLLLRQGRAKAGGVQ